MNKIVKIVIIVLVIVLLCIGFFLFFNPFLVVKLEGDSLVEIDYNGTYTEPGYSASIYGKKITDEVKVEGKVDTTKVGSYKISYRVKSGLTEKIVNRIVLVQDNVAPVLSLKGEEAITVCPNKEYEEEGYSAIDDYDGDITANVEIVNSDGMITYIAKDSSGNESKLERILNIMDDEKPVITLKGESDVTILLNSTYNDQGAIANDNCDEDISNTINVKNNVNTSQVGVYEVEYSVTDSTGNASVVKRIVRVVEKEEETGWYSNIIEGPTYINGILIVNKKYSIPSSFGGDNETANQALYKLQDDAKALGFTANVVSGYRSYYTQRSTYNYWVSVYGQKDADTISARPGHSEHQTGLAFDITSLDSAYGETEEGIWLKENCAKYGFIIRYPKGKEHITGYAYEPWHIRYVGVEAATYIMDNDLTLEEYLGVA